MRPGTRSLSRQPIRLELWQWLTVLDQWRTDVGVQSIRQYRMNPRKFAPPGVGVAEVEGKRFSLDVLRCSRCFSNVAQHDADCGEPDVLPMFYQDW